MMVKPKFEVGRDRLGKGGVLRDLAMRAEAVAAVADEAGRRGWGAQGVTVSPLPGPSGNVEFFVWLRRGPAVVDRATIDEVVSAGPSGVPGERVTE
jgi:23S rRNA (cytidine1920-2'-O)/16S rRNA (cytidine1409-2'-O)-methyltransferase